MWNADNGPIMEAIQIWDTSYANVRKEIKSVVDRRLQQSVDSLWGIEALPFLKQYLLYPYAPEDLAEELLKELANQSEAGETPPVLCLRRSISWLLRGICGVSRIPP